MYTHKHPSFVCGGFKVIQVFIRNMLLEQLCCLLHFLWVSCEFRSMYSETLADSFEKMGRIYLTDHSYAGIVWCGLQEKVLKGALKLNILEKEFHM